MPFKQHGRQYDLVVFGATGQSSYDVFTAASQLTIWIQGYTGKFTVQHIATHLPTNLKWAIAGRSREKLEKVAARLQKINGDRQQPGM